MPPRIIVVDNEYDAGLCVAQLIVDVVRMCNGAAVLSVATGSSPHTTYAELGRQCRSGAIDLSECSFVMLDEYVGLSIGDPRSFRQQLLTTLLDPCGVAATHLHSPPPHSDFAPTFDDEIADLGGVDLQLLGIGRNGHIGFNEPGTPLDSVTHVVELSEQTRLDNSRFFEIFNRMPTHAVTQGLATIIRSKSIILLAFGSAKASAIHSAFHGPITSECPASILQLHTDVTVFADAAAARLVLK